MKKISLNGECVLSYYDEEARRKGLKSDEVSIPAVIPGNVEADLMRAGKLPDLYFGNNIKLARKSEFYCWRYRIAFDLPPLNNGETAYLNFGAVDCFAEYYLNGVKFAQSENALIGHRFLLPKNAKRGENVLEVVIHSPVIYAEQKNNDAFEWAFTANYEGLNVRKAPHEYGWDIMPRLLSAGIIGDVNLEIEFADEITELYIATVDVYEERARMYCHFKLKTSVPYFEGLEFCLSGITDDGSKFAFTRAVTFSKSSFFFDIKNPRLWWPRGYGKASVYAVKAQLKKNGVVIAERAENIGVRTAKLIRTDVLDEFGGDFHFEINGKKIFCRGSNHVPLDALHSRDGERYERVIELYKDLNANMLRSWGGNVYEKDEFFDLCDRAGIMVWQDFAMACAFYPQTEEFCSAIGCEAESVAKRLRNHPSLVLWSGDNECDATLYSAAKHNPADNAVTRVVIPNALKRVDPFRDYLPSSPYVSVKAIEAGNKLTTTPTSKKWTPGEPYKPMLPEDHPWGARDYFKSGFYKNLRCAFISEIGYHGCNDKKSIESFIGKDKIWPWQHNDEWITHAAAMNGENGDYAYRIPLMDRQIYELFGVHPQNLDDYVFASQISQAEADKYFIESSRQLKWARSGII